MPGCMNEFVSMVYIALTGKFLPRAEERMDETQEQLERLVSNLEARSNVLSVQQAALMAEIRTMAPGERRKHKFHEYKRLDSQKERLHSYKDMVLTHLDALSNSELNKSLINTLQESAKTLRALGAVDGVRQAELVVADVESSMLQAQELTQVLGQPMHIDSQGQDLEAELEEFLKQEDEVLKKQLQEKAEAEPVALGPGDVTSTAGSWTRQRSHAISAPAVVAP